MKRRGFRTTDQEREWGLDAIGQKSNKGTDAESQTRGGQRRWWAVWGVEKSVAEKGKRSRDESTYLISGCRELELQVSCRGEFAVEHPDALTYVVLVAPIASRRWRSVAP